MFYFLIGRMSKKSNKTFRLAGVRKRISSTFQSQALKAAMLDSLNGGGDDAAQIVQLMENVRPVNPPPVQAVKPIPIPRDAAPLPGPAQPQAGPAPRPVPPPAAAANGDTEANAVEVMDSDDEFVEELRLTPRRARRLRRQISQWKNSGSD